MKYILGIISGFGLTLSFLIIWFIPDTTNKYVLYFIFAIYGIFYSTSVTSFWPSVKLTVPLNHLTTAYGMAFCIQDATQFFGPMIIGAIIDGSTSRSGGYYWIFAFFVGISIIALVLAVIIYIIDIKDNSVLTKGEQFPEFDETPAHASGRN